MTSLQQEVKKLREFMETNQISASTLAVGEVAVTTLSTTASKDLAIESASGKDITVEMGDNAAANKVSFIDSDESEVAKVDSNGTFDAVVSIAPMKYATADTNGAPTDAECISAFGAAATMGAGFVGIFKDSHESGKVYVCACDGSNYHVAEMTAATT